MKITDHNRYDILRTASEVADYFGCWLRELRGQTLEEILRSAEKEGARVYWGCWTESDLDMVI